MEDLRLFSLLKIVEVGSYTKAAAELSLTQPAVSQHIRQLETTLGIRIFERTHNRLTLTAEGKIVVEYARRMIALSNSMRRALKNEREQIQSLTIGITHTAESSTIIEALAAYISSFSKLNIRVLTFTTDNLYVSLKNYELDFAFVEGKTNDVSLEYMMLDTDCLVLAIPPMHRLASQSMVTIDQLKAERLILRLPNSHTRNLFEASLRSQGLSLDEFSISLEIDSIATIKELVRDGFGVSVLAKSALLNEIRKGTLSALSIENLSMMREINIVCRKDFEHKEILLGIVKKYLEFQGGYNVTGSM
jgi:DNA-binding transcriptional LysR family regulator